MTTEQERTSRNAARLALKAAEHVDTLTRARRLAEHYAGPKRILGPPGTPYEQGIRDLAEQLLTILDGLDA